MSSPDHGVVTNWSWTEFGGEVDGGEPEGPSPAEAAYVEGLAEGRRAAAEEADEKTLAARQALVGAAESLQAVRAALASEVEEALYALAVAVARQIVEREVATDPTIVRDLVRRAVEVLPLEGPLGVKLHPLDLAALGDHLELYAPGGRNLDVRWIPDPSVGRGGYAIETAQRVVDGRVDPALLAMYERLRNA